MTRRGAMANEVSSLPLKDTRDFFFDSPFYNSIQCQRQRTGKLVPSQSSVSAKAAAQGGKHIGGRNILTGTSEPQFVSRRRNRERN